MLHGSAPGGLRDTGRGPALACSCPPLNAVRYMTISEPPRPQPNRKLQAAREALPSPSGAPGLSMSRRELADAANAYVWRHTSGKQHTNMTEHDIGRYERGEVRWPGRWRRLGLRGALKVATDKELGFYPNRQVSPEPVSCAIGECQGPPATDGIDQLTGPSSHNRLPREATSFFHEGDEPFQEDAADELRERLVNVAAVDKRGMELLSIQIDQIREVDRRLGTRASRAQMRGHLAALEQLRTFFNRGTPA